MAKKAEKKSVPVVERVEIPPIDLRNIAVKIEGDSSLVTHPWSEKAKRMMRETQTRKAKGGKKEAEEVSIRQCPKCFYVHVPSPRCPLCGHLYEIKERVPEQVEGELQEVNKELLKKQRRREQGTAQSLEDLIAVGKSRGYKNAFGWANYIYNARQTKRGARG